MSIETLGAALSHLAGQMAMSEFLENDDNRAALNRVVRAWVELRDRDVSTDPREGSEGWIDWHGGECPVLDCVRVDVRFRDGDIAENHDPAGWTWTHFGLNPRVEPSGRDIVAYRVCDAPA